MTNNILKYRIIDTLKKSESKDKDHRYSQTYLVSNQNEAKFILQSIKLENLTNLSELINDILWYKQLNHVHLMPLKDCFLIDSKLNLIKPYARYGSCSDLLSSNPYGICERLIANIIWQTLQAICYLQDRHIMHRGIASKNIFICGDGRVLLDNYSNCTSMISPNDGRIKKQIYDYTDKLKDQLFYLAPEVLYQNVDGYNYKSDVYSLGMVACELANGINNYYNMTCGNISMLYAKMQGSEPVLLDQIQLADDRIGFNNENYKSDIDKIKKRRFSKQFHSFIKSSVSTCVDSRCSPDQLKTHSFFKLQIESNHNPQILYNDMIKRLDPYTKKTSINKQTKDLQEATAFSTNDSDDKQTLTWEF